MWAGGRRSAIMINPSAALCDVADTRNAGMREVSRNSDIASAVICNVCLISRDTGSATWSVPACDHPTIVRAQARFSPGVGMHVPWWRVLIPEIRVWLAAATAVSGEVMRTTLTRNTASRGRCRHRGWPETSRQQRASQRGWRTATARASMHAQTLQLLGQPHF